MQHQDNLVWLDLEMTGLCPATHKILEMAIIVTDSQLQVLAQGPVWVIHQSEAELAKMDEWNWRTHGGSGLVERVRHSTLTEQVAVEQALAFLAPWVPAGASPLCGNSIGQDRRFLHAHMPDLETFFHYRNIDVSTLKELTRRWSPTTLALFQKQGSHQALADILESIAELRFYRQHILRI